MKALDDHTKASRDLLHDLQDIAKSVNPLAKLVRNMAEARRKEHESGIHSESN